MDPSFWDILLADRWAHVAIIVCVVLFACWISWMVSASRIGSSSTLLSATDENALGVMLVKRASSLLEQTKGEADPVRKLIFATAALSFMDAADKTANFQTTLEQDSKVNISQVRGTIEAQYQVAQNQINLNAPIVARGLWSL